MIYFPFKHQMGAREHGLEEENGNSELIRFFYFPCIMFSFLLQLINMIKY